MLCHNYKKGSAMQDKQQPETENEEIKDHACRFILEYPNGPYAKGKCSICGKEDTFANSGQNALKNKKGSLFNS